jgi:hypothetical protein
MLTGWTDHSDIGLFLKLGAFSVFSLEFWAFHLLTSGQCIRLGGNK